MPKPAAWSHLFDHPVFQEAIADFACLGIHIDTKPGPGAKPYAVIGGRSNARWWLVPLDSGQLTAGGLALFQPVLLSARVMKAAAGILSRIGLSGLWVRTRVFVKGAPEWSKYFASREPLTFAYFTGTNSPHRKIAVQIMNIEGGIKGFAKVSRTPAVRELLKHEAAILTHVAELGLASALIPKTLCAGEYSGAGLLLTDTQKTSRTQTTTILSSEHLAFLNELAARTAVPQDGRTIKSLKQRYGRVAARLTLAWRQRLEEGLGRLEASTHELLPTSLTHGDFTPWNTFLVDGKLYVFDWEYADTDYPASNDLIHFLLATPGFGKKPPAEQIRLLASDVMHAYKIDAVGATNHLIVYLLSHNLRYIERLDAGHDPIEDWDGADESAKLIDEILTPSNQS